MLDAMAMLTGRSVGDLIYTIIQEGSGDSLVRQALEIFHDKYYLPSIMREEGPTELNDLAILKQCLVDTQLTYKAALAANNNPDEIAALKADIDDLNYRIALFR